LHNPRVDDPDQIPDLSETTTQKPSERNRWVLRCSFYFDSAPDFNTPVPIPPLQFSSRDDRESIFFRKSQNTWHFSATSHSS